MGLTALFYTLVGVAFSFGALRLTENQFDPHVFWSCSFIFAGALAASGWLSGSYKTAQNALIVCSAVSLGFALTFLAKLLTGDPSYFLGSAIWLYMAYSHFVIARLPDPYILNLLDYEVSTLKTQLGTARDGE